MDKLRHRVAVFSSEYPPHVFGGLGTHVGEITSALAGLVKFELFVPAQGDYAQVQPAISLHEVPIMAARGNVELWLQYCSAALKAAEGFARSIDLIHCHDWMTVAAGIKLREISGKPLVFNVHLPQEVDAYQGLEGLGLVHADLVLVNSFAVEQEIRARHLPVKRMEVVPNGVNLKTFNSGGEWAADNEYMLFVGRLVPQKGVVLLLRALSVVLRRCPDANLVVAGDGEMELLLKRITRYLGIPHRVSFVSWRTGEELVDLYRQAQFVVIPSYYEPFGIVALEAMACGRPVIASCTGGLDEIIEDGVNGYLVPVADHLKFAQRMVTLIQDPARRETMGEAARLRAAEFSWVNTGAQTLSLYDDLVGSHTDSCSSLTDLGLRASLLEKLDEHARAMVMSILN